MISSLVIRVIALALFIVAERRKSPMILISSNHAPSHGKPVDAVVVRALGVVFFLVPLLLMQVQGYSTTAAGAAAAVPDHHVRTIALVRRIGRADRTSDPAHSGSADRGD